MANPRKSFIISSDSHISDSGIKLVDFLQKVRIELIQRYKSGDLDYHHKKIISYLGSPNPNLKINKLNIDPDSLTKYTNSELLSLTLGSLNEFYISNKREYVIICTQGQYFVWESVFHTIESLLSIKYSLNKLNHSLRDSDYYGSCQNVQKCLDYLAKAYNEMVVFEKKMGVDRYLATSGLTEDMQIIHDIVREIRNICNSKLEEYIQTFQIQWNLTSVSKSIKKSLDLPVIENEVTLSMSVNKERVIFLLLDGFGYTQYLWFLKGLKERKSTTFSINIFEWLKSFTEYQDKLILGSNLVSDTASCLSTIFSGELPKDTGVISSKIFQNGRIEDIKKFRGYGLRKMVKKYPNTFLEDLKFHNISILNGSGYVEWGNEESFSKLIYGNSKIIPVDPMDRIFKSVIKEIDVNQKQLIMAYIPLIDRTGHSIGSFTSFESYEYEKLNILLVEFLLDLAFNKSELFDGKTKIIISADHGMFETSSKYISMNEIKHGFNKRYLRPPMIAINNRSILLYNVSDLGLYRTVISEILDEKEISHKIYSKDDFFALNFIPLELQQNTLIILFDNDGIALTKDKDENLLHFGGHGGCSCEEVFIPFITLDLTRNLHSNLINHFSKIK